MAFTFFKFSRVNTLEEIEKVRKLIRTGLQRGVDEVIMAERGMGMDTMGLPYHCTEDIQTIQNSLMNFNSILIYWAYRKHVVS